METALCSRAHINALSDYEAFLDAARHLKALTLTLRDRQTRESGFQKSLQRQITSITHVCEEHAANNKRIGELWRRVQAELAEAKPEPTGE